MIMLLTIIITLIKILIVLLPVLLSVAWLTVFERKVLGSMQLRMGPTSVGYLGILVCIADAIKLFAKENIIPTRGNKIIFMNAPILALFLVLISWVTLPFGEGLQITELNIGVLYLMTVAALNIYCSLMAGWGSNSKYPILASLRASAQGISYEVSLGLLLLNVIILAGSIKINAIMQGQSDIMYLFPLLPVAVLYYISILAELGRTPFCVIEAESELLSGVNTEYSSFAFSEFFITEYGHIILNSFIFSLVFLGGQGISLEYTLFPVYVLFAIKVLFILYSIIWTRAVLPRFRYNSLMSLMWKQVLPFSIAYLLFTIGFFLFITF